MTRRTIEQRLAQLEAQKKMLQSRLGKQERARDTRRKVLLADLMSGPGPRSVVAASPSSDAEPAASTRALEPA